MVSNRDIGFVRVLARMGRSKSIPSPSHAMASCAARCSASPRMPSAATSRRTNPKSVPGADNASSEPKGQDLSYAARISLDRTQMQIDDNLVNLGMGMAVTVEIKTGSRSVLSYLLSPILKYKHETLRER